MGELDYNKVNKILNSIEKDVVMKGGLPVGTVHQRADGRKYQKQQDGSWIPVKSDNGGKGSGSGEGGAVAGTYDYIQDRLKSNTFMPDGAKHAVATLADKHGISDIDAFDGRAFGDLMEHIAQSNGIEEGDYEKLKDIVFNDPDMTQQFIDQADDWGVVDTKNFSPSTGDNSTMISSVDDLNTNYEGYTRSTRASEYSSMDFSDPKNEPYKLGASIISDIMDRYDNDPEFKKKLDEDTYKINEYAKDETPEYLRQWTLEAFNATPPDELADWLDTVDFYSVSDDIKKRMREYN